LIDKDFYDHEEFVAKALRYQVGVAVEKQDIGLNSLNSHVIEYNAKMLLFKLYSTVLSREISKEVISKESLPLDWWQSFKLKWFPKWLKRKYPIKYRVIETVVQKFHNCPHDFIKIPDEHLKWLQFNPKSNVCC
jgi:hypothetical protein